MVSPQNISDLEVVGYANVLKETMLPAVMAPVFRLKLDSNRLFVPPFSMRAGYLCDATELSVAEMDHLRDAGEVTLLESGFQARIDFELWIDQAWNVRYQPIVDAKRELSQISIKAIAAAETALGAGDIDLAERLSSTAGAADHRRLAPFALKAAIRVHQGKQSHARLMAKLVSNMVSEDEFRVQVDRYLSLIKPPKKSDSRRWMHDVGRQKAA